MNNDREDVVVRIASNIRGRVWRGGKAQDDFEFDKISDHLTEPDTLAQAATGYRTTGRAEMPC